MIVNCSLGCNMYLKDRHSAYIRQLFPTSTPLGRIKLKVFGNSGVGKSTLIESLKCGYFSNLLRKAGITSSSTNMSSVPQKGGNGMEKHCICYYYWPLSGTRRTNVACLYLYSNLQTKLVLRKICGMLLHLCSETVMHPNLFVDFGAI